MDNIMLLNILYGEWAKGKYDLTLHIDDIKAIDRVAELLKQDLPKEEK